MDRRRTGQSAAATGKAVGYRHSQFLINTPFGGHRVAVFVAPGAWVDQAVIRVAIRQTKLIRAAPPGAAPLHLSPRRGEGRLRPLPISSPVSPG